MEQWGQHGYSPETPAQISDANEHEDIPTTVVKDSVSVDSRLFQRVGVGLFLLKVEKSLALVGVQSGMHRVESIQKKRRN